MSTDFPFGANAMAKKPAATKEAKPAKKSTAALAREYHKANPKATTQEIADAIKTTYNNVYQALNKSGKKKKGKRGPNGKAPVAAHAALDHAFDFVQKVGGLVHAESLIEKLKAFKAKL